MFFFTYSLGSIVISVLHDFFRSFFLYRCTCVYMQDWIYALGISAYAPQARTCKYICIIYIYTYIHTYIHTYVHTHTYVRTRTNKRVCVCVRVSVCVCVRLWLCVCARARSCLRCCDVRRVWSLGLSLPASRGTCSCNYPWSRPRRRDTLSQKAINLTTCKTPTTRSFGNLRTRQGIESWSSKTGAQQ